MIGRLPRNLQRSLQGLLEPSARSDSGQNRGGFSEQTHGRAGYLAVVGGEVIVAAVDQTILTTAGVLSGWISTIVSVSAPLMGPDRMVDWVIGTRFLAKWVSGPSRAAISWRATSHVPGVS
jgi:hypothetical protein